MMTLCSVQHNEHIISFICREVVSDLGWYEQNHELLGFLHEYKHELLMDGLVGFRFGLGLWCGLGL